MHKYKNVLIIKKKKNKQAMTKSHCIKKKFFFFKCNFFAGNVIIPSPCLYLTFHVSNPLPLTLKKKIFFLHVKVVMLKDHLHVSNVPFM